MTQPKKLTVPALQAQIVKRQGALLRQIATRHHKIAELNAEIADLHGQLHELPNTMVDVWHLGRRAGYAVRAERAS
jgi:hypothetical protein